MKWLLLLALVGTPALASDRGFYMQELDKNQICKEIAEEYRAAVRYGALSRTEARRLIRKCLIKYAN